MRHFVANLATYVIGTLLVVASALFAWIRSEQLVITPHSAVLAAYDRMGEQRFAWEELGAHSYLANCANCHRADGSGWDQYPGVGHTARLFNAPRGREYLIDLHLYGLQSPRWRVPMPPMGHLNDIELAAVLNHLLSGYGNENERSADLPLYTSADIAARRGQDLRPAEVNAKRPQAD
jgi:mono/diheme cytochrome c family protein